jgi:hypothetical protein
MPVFLDTNVFLYAAGAPHPQKEACVRVLQRAASGQLVATTNTEVVRELLYVLDRKQRRQDGIALISADVHFDHLRGEGIQRLDPAASF